MALNFKIAKSGGAASHQGSGAIRTLLLVDDDQTLLLMLRMFFQKNGWHLLEADTVEEAVKLWDANQKHIDAVVTDYSFAGTATGLDLVTYIQASRRGFPCVVISGLWLADKRPRDEPQMNLYYRIKPFDPRELLATVVKAIESAAPQKTT